jgi:hypothetical protein
MSYLHECTLCEVTEETAEKAILPAGWVAFKTAETEETCPWPVELCKSCTDLAVAYRKAHP